MPGPPSGPSETGGDPSLPGPWISGAAERLSHPLLRGRWRSIAFVTGPVLVRSRQNVKELLEGSEILARDEHPAQQDIGMCRHGCGSRPRVSARHQAASSHAGPARRWSPRPAPALWQAQRSHGLGDDVFPQYLAERSATVTVREGRPVGALQLDVARSRPTTSPRRMARPSVEGEVDRHTISPEAACRLGRPSAFRCMINLNIPGDPVFPSRML